MYKSPIELLSARMSEYKVDTEKMVIEAVFKTGVNVDKDELIRALQYDRDQYAKGYADAKTEVAREIFEEIEKYEYHDLSGKTIAYMLYAKDIAELKKKYTEGET